MELILGAARRKPRRTVLSTAIAYTNSNDALNNVFECPLEPPVAPDRAQSFRYREAALVVVVYHFRMMWAGSLAWYGWHKWVNLSVLLLASGPESVILFFLLSAFVLSLPYLKGNGPTYPAFISRRVLRIYGPYLFALALAVAGNAVWHGPLGNGAWASHTWSQPLYWRIIWQHILFLGLNDVEWPQLNTAFWSLVIEMRVSILFPMLVIGVLYLSDRLALLIAVIMFAVPAMLFHANPLWVSTQLTLQVVGVFVIGILLAKNITQFTGWIAAQTTSTKFLFFGVSYTLFALGDRIANSTLIPWGGGIALNTLGSVGLIVLSLGLRPVSNVLQTPVPLFLGRISYSLYLVHGTVLFALTYWLQGRLSTVAQFCVFLFTSLVSATIFCITVEEPLVRLSRRLGARVSGQRRADNPLIGDSNG